MRLQGRSPIIVLVLASLMLVACGEQLGGAHGAGTASVYEVGSNAPATDDTVAVEADWPDRPSLKEPYRSALVDIQEKITERAPTLYTGSWGSTEEDDNPCEDRVPVLGVQSPSGVATAVAALREHGLTPLTDACEGDVLIDVGENPTVAEMYAIQDRAYDYNPPWDDNENARVTSAAVDWTRHIVWLDVFRLTDEFRRALKDAFGDRVIVSVTGSRPMMLTPDRGHDNSSFYGGGRYRMFSPAIWAANQDWDAAVGGMCTNGVPWVINGVHHMITAGHCFPQGDTFVGAVTKSNDQNLWMALGLVT